MNRRMKRLKCRFWLVSPDLALRAQVPDPDPVEPAPVGVGVEELYSPPLEGVAGVAGDPLPIVGAGRLATAVPDGNGGVTPGPATMDCAEEARFEMGPPGKV